MSSRRYKYSLVAMATLFLTLLSASCKKEKHEDNLPASGVVHNGPPLANAGGDQSILLRIGMTVLDGSGSADPENNITSYSWTKILGPSSFNLFNETAVKTEVNNLVQGVYLFELKVTDAAGLFSKDTVQISVEGFIGPDNDNVIFFFRDTTGGLDVEHISVIEGFWPRTVLVNVSVGDYINAEIEGVWSNKYSPRCPGSINYADATSFGSFELSPGTYRWVAESVTIALDGYPDIPYSFRHYWGSGPHKAEGTIVVQQGDCLVKEIIF